MTSDQNFQGFVSCLVAQSSDELIKALGSLEPSQTKELCSFLDLHMDQLEILAGNLVKAVGMLDDLKIRLLVASEFVT